jgi:hypothetical protein
LTYANDGDASRRSPPEGAKKVAEQGRTLTSLLEEGLKPVLVESKPAKRARVRLPVSTARGGTLPGIDLNRSADLEDRMQGL